MIRDVKILEVHLNRHAGWNTYIVNTVQVIWVIVWIPRTCQCVVYHSAAFYKTKGHSGNLLVFFVSKLV